MLDLIVRGGQIVNESGVFVGDIGIKEGKIVLLSDKDIQQDSIDFIDAAGKIIMPGFIDVHVHHRTQVPGLTTVDSPAEVSQIAAQGGITTFLFYIGARWSPKEDNSGNKGQSPTNPEDFFGPIIEEEENSLVTDFGIHCMLFANQEIIKQIPEITKMGIKSFKMVLGYHPSRGWVLDDALIMQILETVASSDSLAMFHCENGYVIGYLEDKFIKQGNYTFDTFLKARPNLAEAETVNRVICLADMTGCPIYIVHLSAKEGLDYIINAKMSGRDITAETCPQYLLLNEDDVQAQHELLKMAPPIRTVSDNEALWKGLKTGYIEIVGSDHVSLSREQKTKARDFQSVPFGIPGIETIGPLLYGEGVAKGRMTLPEMVKVLSSNPAKKFGFYPLKGVISIGSDADMVIIDPEIEWEITADKLHSKAGFTPYEGRKIKGKPVISILRGKVLLKDGRVHQKPGYGKYLFR